jgi:hypothetical protein
MRIDWRRFAHLIAFVSLLAFTGTAPSLAQESETCISQEDRTAPPAPTPREVGYPHVEVDLSLQRLFIVDAFGCVTKTLPISSGSGRLFTSEGWTRRAITPTGRFTVDRKIEGWLKAPLGMLYYPSFIYEGVAIHGSPSVPRTPASHGCIRIPMSAAKEFFETTPIGTIVLVY